MTLHHQNKLIWAILSQSARLRQDIPPKHFQRLRTTATQPGYRTERCVCGFEWSHLSVGLYCEENKPSLRVSPLNRGISKGSLKIKEVGLVYCPQTTTVTVWDDPILHVMLHAGKGFWTKKKTPAKQTSKKLISMPSGSSADVAACVRSKSACPMFQ